MGNMSTYVTALLGAMGNMVSYLWSFAEGNEVLSTIVLLPVVGGVVAKVVSVSRKARG